MGAEQSSSRSSRSRSHEDLVQDILDQQRAAYDEKVRQTLLARQRAAAISNAHGVIERPAPIQNTSSQLYPNLRTSENVIQPTISKDTIYDSPNTSNVQRNTNPLINQPSTPTRSVASPSAPPPSAPVTSISNSSNANAPATPAPIQNTSSHLYPNLRTSENVIQPTISKASFYDPPNLRTSENVIQPTISKASFYDPPNLCTSENVIQPTISKASFYDSPNLRTSQNVIQPTISKASFYDSPNLRTSQNVIQPTISKASFYDSPNLRTSQNVIQPTISKASFYDSPNKSNVQRNTNPLINQPSIPTRSAASPSAPPPPAPVASTSRSSIANAPTTSKYSSRRTDDENRHWKCITCNNVLSVKIYQCGQGHSSCLVCKFKGLSCGVCRYPITDTRNIDLERYIEEVQQKTVNDPERAVDCPNKSDGCRLSFKQGNMDAHLKECPFREMDCPVAFLYGGCFWRGKINHIKEHISECHPNQAGADVDTEMTLNFHVGNNTVHHVVMGNFHFLVNLKLDAEALYSTAQLIGSRISASKWIYELHVYNKSEPRRKYTFNDTCIPNSDIFSDICKESKCAALPWPYVTSFVNNNALTYKFYIKKISKSETDDSRPRRRYGKTVHKNNNKSINT